MKTTISCFIAIAAVFCLNLSFSQIPQLDWAARLQHPDGLGGLNVQTDLVGNFYIGGVFAGDLDIDPGPGTQLLSTADSTTTGYFLAKFDPNAQLSWFLRLDSAEMPLHVMYHVDGAGNVVLSGQFRGTADFDPGVGVFTMSSASPSWYDAFVMRLDGNGALVWAKSIQGNTDVENGACLLDAAGNFLMLGTVHDVADLDPSPSSSMLVTAVAGYSQYIVKWNANGDFLWGYGWDSRADANMLAADATGNIYAYGSYFFTADLDPTAGVYSVTTASLHSSFVTKLSANGAFLWGRELDCTIENFESSITLDPLGNPLVAGIFVGDLDIDPGTGTQNLTSAANSYDWFLVRLDGNGNLINGFQLGGANDEFYPTAVFDPSGNLFVAGQFAGPVDFDPGLAYNDLQVPTGSSTALLKYDPSGNLLWGASFDTLGAVSVGGLALDPVGNLYCSGFFIHSVDFDLRAGTTILTSDAYGDKFLMKLNQDSCANLALLIDSVAPLNCAGQGYISGHPANGLAPYTYAWGTVPVGVDSFVNVTVSGIYTVTLTDANGCFTTRTVYVPSAQYPSGFDLGVYVVPGTMRAGVVSDLWVEAGNDGCVATSGQMNLTLDTNVTFVSATPPPSNIAGQVLTWDFVNWTADSPHLQAHVQVLPGATLLPATELCFEAVISPDQGDGDTSNHHALACVPLQNSYDPNAKAAFPQGACDEGYILPSQRLTYAVRFQNMGNAEAIHVTVVDTLDPLLDFATVKVVGASHPGLITELEAGNVLRFRFLDIHLPDSATNEVASHGYVIFEVDPVSGLSPGAVITNDANIYFDYNIAVTTNRVQHTVTNTIPNAAASISVNGTMLTAQPAGGTYQWYTCTDQLVPIPGANAQNFVPTSGGYYAVQVSSGNCTVRSVCTQFSTVDAPAATLQQQVKLFPNPTQRGEVTLDFGTWRGPAYVEVRNAMGAILYTEHFTPQASAELQLSGPSGLYYVTLLDRNGAHITWKVVRE